MARRKPLPPPPKPTLVQKLPAEVPGLLALFLSILVILALISHTPGDGQGAAVRNYIGGAGIVLSDFLIRFFGLLAFWPAPALFWGSCYILKNPARRAGLFSSLVGLLLTLFALCALAGLIWPDPRTSPPWPGSPGGGLLGAFLARGLQNGLGRVGGLLAAPLLAWGGIMIFTGLPLKSFIRFLGRAGRFLFRTGAKEKPIPAAEPVLKIRPRRKKTRTAEELPEAGPAGSEERPRDLGLDPPAAPAEKPALVFREKKKKAQAAPAGRPEAAVFKSGEYELPELELLDAAAGGEASSGLTEEEMTANARLLEKKLLEFKVEGQVTGVSWGPVITQYEFQPAPGIKIGRITALAADLTMALKTTSCRVTGAIPGKGAIGLELPNPNRQLVCLREVLESCEFQNSPSPLSLALGVDITGQPVVRDLVRMPHLLIAGATGSGKSVCLDSLIMSIFYKSSPLEVRFLMIDPKCVELAQYQDLPHLLHPVLTDPEEATVALKWAVSEMDLRYKLMAEKGVRQITKYNDLIKYELAQSRRSEEGDPPQTLPYLVIIIDELSDLMLTAAKEVEVSITRLAAKARASGIHLILATQRPSVDVLTGVIKANLPTRISFQVSSKIDS
ncbi:MAG: DNA translocase FtsK 4TM domain-containing protein, partial [Deltaproteobacteria bacterium]|nr:DNA translocase FtsK 4TM domain-containing protein [Deltaproteobacteria bacterium]